MRRSLDASLRRLGLDRVDMVLVHDPDDHADQAIAEALPALIGLRDQGMIGAVGLGMNQWQVPLRAVQETDLDVVMLAGGGRWRTAAVRRCSRRAPAAACRYWPRARSIPACWPRPWPPDGAHFNYAPAPAPILEHARRLARRSEQHGLTLPQAALRFPLRHQAVAGVVAGLGSARHVRSAAGWLAGPVPDTGWMQEVTES